MVFWASGSEVRSLEEFIVKEYETVFPIMPRNVRDEFSLLIKRSFKCTFETFPVRCPNAIFYFDDQLAN